MATGRTEAFSDGVFAVAITLLILNVLVPEVRDGQLYAALLKRWPVYTSYAVSFLTIGIIWVNHHTMFSYIEKVDRMLLFLNLAFLMTVVFIPFPTALLGAYIVTPENSHVAAVVYSGTMTAMGLTFAAMWIYVGGHKDLLNETFDPVAARKSAPRFGAGTFIYGASIAVAFVSAYICLIIYALLALFYVFDQLSDTGQSKKDGEPAS
ncbi:MAG: TMEM175 family protein [Chloroflexota bacterium]|nr:MAG: DUF1211 domain-containing protein [Chloroflexota bacterium]